MENKYQKGQIYKIVDTGFNKCYIGSTCEKLSQRMVRHRINYRRYLKGSQKHSRVVDIFDEYGVENCKILWVEDYPCNSKKELQAREGYYQQKIECVNKKIEGRTHQEYRDQHKEQNKQWRQENQEHLKQYIKNYNEAHKGILATCECGITLTKKHLTRHKKSKQHQDWLKQQEQE